MKKKCIFVDEFVIKMAATFMADFTKLKIFGKSVCAKGYTLI